MPVITIEGAALSKEQKTELVQKITKTAGEIMKIPEHAYTILIKENNFDNIGVGGKLLSDLMKSENS
ncbi:MAG: tautomerase family protein [Bacteroidetes bacterium]|nr:tautomerase family protein [Bacteroidota bacterium]